MTKSLKTFVLFALTVFAAPAEGKAQGCPPIAPPGYVYVWRYDWCVDPFTGVWMWQYRWVLAPAWPGRRW